MNGWWGKNYSRASTEAPRLPWRDLPASNHCQPGAISEPRGSSVILKDTCPASLWICMKTSTVHMNTLIDTGCLLQSVGPDKASWDYSKCLGTRFDQHPFHESPSFNSNKCFLPPSQLKTTPQTKKASARAWEIYQEDGSTMGAPMGSNHPGQPQSVMFFCSTLSTPPEVWLSMLKVSSDIAQSRSGQCPTSEQPDTQLERKPVFGTCGLHQVSPATVCAGASDSAAPARQFSQSLESKHRSSQTQHKMGNASASKDS